MKFDKANLPALIILIQREHQRLNIQIKRLQAYALGVEDLQKYQDYWVSYLGFVDYLPPLLRAMDHLINQHRQGQATDADYDEVVFQIGVYKKASWAFIRTFYGSINPYVDRWLKALPMVRYTFEQYYEARQKLSVAEQGELIRSLVEAVPNRNDPHRQRQGPSEQRVLHELGILDGAKERGNKPAKTGQVVEFQAFKKRRR